MKYFLQLLFVGLLFSCSSHKNVSANKLQNGDLIFVEAKQENLSGAINRVTQKSKIENFDHIGLIEITSDGIFILHASPKLGSNRQTLNDFYNENRANHQNMVVYRLKAANKNATNLAIENAKSMLGKPYNWTYILNDSTYYCSDFIERAFRENEVFEQIPMNFKNPQTQQIDDFWIDFYKKLNLEVPQDQPGTNPNQLAGSEKLERIGILNNINVK